MSADHDTVMTRQKIMHAGNFSCLAAAFQLHRRIGSFVMRSYIPAILIVMLSWVGFWINKNSDPARVSLGVITVLAMTTLAATSRQISVSYLKALDVWYAVCLFLVFAALVEYAFINVFVRGEKKKPEQPATTDTVYCTLMNTYVVNARIDIPA